MRIVESNRLEVLAEDLINSWPDAAAETLSARPIVVPSLGMGRWLTYRLAAAFGVCAQVDFVYPATFVWSLFGRVVPEIRTRSPFDAESMTWRIYRLLGRIDGAFASAPLADYLLHGTARDRLALSRRLASMFSEILAARPEWPERWHKGELCALQPSEHERWQAALWRAIASEIPAAAQGHPRDAVFARLAAEPAARTRLPPSVVVFAVPHMAALYQGIFEALSRYTDVTVYLVNPSPQYWFDLQSEQRAARAALKHGHAGQALHAGPTLLAALGRQIQDNLMLWGIADDDRLMDIPARLEERFIEPSDASLLGRLQLQVYAAGDEAEPMPLELDDRSVQIHRCHSLARQLEVLHDQILAQFDALRGPQALSPGEVLVLVPDLDAAAATIDAVFGSAPAERAIPYVVSGRSRDHETPLLRAFFSILSMASGRFTLSEIAELLMTDALAARFGLASGQAERILQWLERTGVHWGRDASTRERFGGVSESRHTFAHGLAALYLGYASLSAVPALMAEVLPDQGIEGKDAEALGMLTALLSRLQALETELAAARPVSAWVLSFSALIERFFERRADPQFELSRLDDALAALGRSAGEAGDPQEISLAVMIDALKHALTLSAPGAVPSGAVTFCGLGPLRQLPYRLVAMLELNGDGSFPRHAQRAEFDLLAHSHRLGDRHLLDEDRAAVLEGVMAARQQLHLFYTGRSVRENALLPPSSVLEELIDALGRLMPKGRSALTPQVIIEHPLQPFSPRYFACETLFTYATELLPAGRTDRQPLAAFFPTALPAAPASWRQVDCADLFKALYDPIRFVLEARVGLSLGDDLQRLSDDEPLQLPRRHMYRLRQRLFDYYQAGVRDDALARLALAAPEVPEGVLGPIAMAPELALVARFAQAVATHLPTPLHGQRIDLRRGAFALSGQLDGLYAQDRYQAVLAPMDDRGLLRAWLAHLVLQLLPMEDSATGRRSCVLFADVLVQFQPVPQAGVLMDQLLDTYWRALHEPLALLPRLSYPYVAAGALPQARAQALAGWRGQSWDASAFHMQKERKYRLAFSALLDDLPAGFEDLATTLYQPMCDHLQITALDTPLLSESAERWVPTDVDERPGGST